MHVILLWIITKNQKISQDKIILFLSGYVANTFLDLLKKYFIEYYLYLSFNDQHWTHKVCQMTCSGYELKGRGYHVAVNSCVSPTIGPLKNMTEHAKTRFVRGIRELG